MKVEILDPQAMAFLIHDFLMPQECQAYIAIGESLGFTPAPLTTARGPVMAPDIRNNTRVMVDDPTMAKSIWNRAQPFVPPTALDWEDVACHCVGLNERFRFFRYDPQQKFARHYDGAFRRNSNEGSLLSFMVYLNEGFQGGETRFYDDSNKLRFAVRPRQGTALIFQHNQLHEGATVTEGRKYVLRTDVMYRRPQTVILTR